VGQAGSNATSVTRSSAKSYVGEISIVVQHRVPGKSVLNIRISALPWMSFESAPRNPCCPRSCRGCFSCGGSRSRRPRATALDFKVRGSVVLPVKLAKVDE